MDLVLNDVFLFLEILKGKRKMGNNNDSMEIFLQYLSYMY